jgi:radical SAM protein with 4Fe4S-binding SPASM domain
MLRLGWLDYEVEEAGVRSYLQARVIRHLQECHNAKGRLQTIYLFLTRRCNLSCKHCYIKGVGPARDTDFDLPSIQRLIDHAIRHGLKKVKVSGGEPFVRPDVLDVLRYLDMRNLEIVLETNGTLIASDTVAQLNELKKFTIFISLDHLEESEHDSFRGLAGSYRKTVKVLQELGRTGIDSVVTTTANRYNYDRIAEIADMVLGWNCKRHRTLLNIHPLGNARSHLDNAITLEEAEVLINSLFQSPHFHTERANMTMPPALMPVRFIKDLRTCGWGDSVIGILSNGDVSMCSASYDDPDMIGGNAFKEDFIDIWRNGQFFRELRSVGEGMVKGVCSNCVFFSVCRGVCRMSSYSHYGETHAPYPLCQEVYNRGGFPRYALEDPDRDCSYRGQMSMTSRPVKTENFVPRVR